MATKPSSTPGWVPTGTEPSAGEKTAGYAVGDPLPSAWLNWFWTLVSNWIAYLRDGVIVGEAGQPGLTVTGGSGNNYGLRATGTGSFPGADFTGGPTNGQGFVAGGVGTGHGGTVTGGTGAGADGLRVNAAGTNNTGLRVQGNGTGSAIVATGGSTAAAATLTGGSGGARAVTATGTVNNEGLRAVGHGTAAGAVMVAGTTATGADRTAALALDNGDLAMAGVANVDSGEAILKTLTPSNIPKVWGVISGDGAGNYTIEDGFNITSAAQAPVNTRIRITIEQNMADGDYHVSVGFAGGLPALVPVTLNNAAGLFDIDATDMAAAAFDLKTLTGTQRVTFEVIGNQ